MADFDPRCEAWPDFSADEIVRRVRCLADDEPDEGDSPAQVWRHACDTILLRMGKHPSQLGSPATPSPEGEVEGLSKKATQGEWLPDVHVYYDEDSGPSEDRTEGVMVLDHDDQPDSIIQCTEDDARFIAALVNAYRSGRLVEAFHPTPSLQTQGAINPPDRREEGSRDATHLEWAVSRWNAEVANRPVRNVHRRALDDTWRQMIRRFGGDPETLVGPSHDDLAVSDASPRPSKKEQGDASNLREQSAREDLAPATRTALASKEEVGRG